MKKLIFLCCIATALLISCTSHHEETELTEEQKTIIQNEVKAVVEGYTNSINQLDHDLWTEYWSTNEFISYLSPRRGLIPDLDSWIDTVKVSFNNRERHNSDVQDLLITPISQDLALVNRFGIWENWFVNGDYRKTQGATTFLLKKEDGEWKIVYAMEGGQLLEEELADEQEPE